MLNHTDEPIIIVGAGWAGLACALTLTSQNQKVLLLEASPQAGGRARGVLFGEDLVDNGQHLFIGAYQHTLSLLKILSIPEENLFHLNFLCSI
jgi:hydroxysqualene dehydroxylase